jgi:hypothetical protein
MASSLPSHCLVEVLLSIEAISWEVVSAKSSIFIRQRGSSAECARIIFRSRVGLSRSKPGLDLDSSNICNRRNPMRSAALEMCSLATQWQVRQKHSKTSPNLRLLCPKPARKRPKSTPFKSETTSGIGNQSEALGFTGVMGWGCGRCLLTGAGPYCGPIRTENRQ